MRYVRASAIVLLLSSLLALLARAPMAAGRQAHALQHLGNPVAHPPPGTYLFVELWVEVRGTGTLPPLIVEAPGYQFNPPTGVLLPTLQPIPPLYPSSWGFAGHGTSRKGTAGSGTRSSLSVIPTMPYSTTLAIGDGTAGPEYEHTRTATVELLAADEDGVLLAQIDGARIELVPGGRWQKTVGADLKAAPYKGHYDVISSVTNYGWQVRRLAHAPTEFVWVPAAAR